MTNTKEGPRSSARATPQELMDMTRKLIELTKRAVDAGEREKPVKRA